jgi:transposase-like protein
VIKRVVAKAWRQSEAAEAEQELATLAWQLEEEGYKEAAGSLREGLRETLTVARLGLSRGLRRKLTTTNTIESAFSTVGRTARRVTNWQSGAQALRWVAVGLEAAQRTFRMSLSRVEVAELARALDRVAPNRQDDHAA